MAWSAKADWRAYGPPLTALTAMSRPGILNWIDENWADIECQFYGGVQAGAFNAAIGSAFTGKIPLALGLAGVSYAAQKTAEMAGCNYRPPESPPALIGGCKKIQEGGTGTLYLNDGQRPAPGLAYAYKVVEIIAVETKFVPSLNEERWNVIYRELSSQGGTRVNDVEFAKDGAISPYATLIPNEGSTCEGPAPEPELPVHNPGDPISDPVTHTDGDCNWSIQATDAYVDDQGVWHTYYTITADNDACGGPFAYWSSDDGPQYVSPKPDPDSDPDNPTVDPTPYPPPDYNPRFDDIEEKLDELKDCACPEDEPIQGQFRTISFRSDETSPFGKSRLRKRLRYRGSESVELSALVDHWRDFSWQSGAVRVQHLGASWGAPSVWASTANEGKRVLLHAGREAGIDPNQVGRWKIGSSNNSRLGVSDTMRVDTTGGYYWITARDGSDQRPIVAK